MSAEQPGKSGSQPGGENAREHPTLGPGTSWSRISAREAVNSGLALPKPPSSCPTLRGHPDPRRVGDPRWCPRPKDARYGGCPGASEERENPVRGMHEVWRG